MHRILFTQMARVFTLLMCAFLLIPTFVHAQAPNSFKIGDPAADQQLAMHTSARGDIAKNPDVPLYRIVGTIDPAKRTWQATQTLTFRNKSGATLTKLYFRLFPNLPDIGGNLTVSSATVNGKTVVVRSEANRYLARLDLATPIANGTQVTVVLKFITTAPNNGGTSLYGTLNQDGQTLSLTSAYPHLANNTNGVWDTTVPNTKGDLVTSTAAYYDVTVTAPTTHTIVSTGTNTTSSKVGTSQTVRMVSGLQRDFALAATKLASINATVDGTKINAYYPIGNLKGGQAALKYASQSLHFYNITYGQYPYNELDLVTVNAGTFEGIEFPGFILFEQRRYNTSADFESLVIHEVAHQWFYNVIGNDVQNHAWVDEGLATYSQVLYHAALRGAAAGTKEKNIFVADYNDLKAQKGDGAIDRPISTMSDYSYGVLTYSKAALYFDAIRTKIGAVKFTAAIRNYYTTNRYGLVDGMAFVRAAQTSCGCDLLPLYNQWVLAK
jgi:aminopeptidase N